MNFERVIGRGRSNHRGIAKIDLIQYDYTSFKLSVDTMAKFLIEGGNPLSGQIAPIGNKNAILKMMAATLLTKETVLISNVPAISDVEVMVALLEDLGAKVTYKVKSGELAITAKEITKNFLNPDLAKKMRSSNVLMGPLLVRTGSVTAHQPGGDKIGPREMNAHFDGFKQLGAKVKINPDNSFTVSGKLTGAEVFLYEPSVTATENILMAAVLTPGITVIDNAASEPHVTALTEMLISMGAQITGVGSNRLTVEGVKTLQGVKVATPPDFVYIGTMIVLSVITGGTLTIKPVPQNFMKPFEYFFAKLGVTWTYTSDSLVVGKNQSKMITDTVWARTKGIYSQPWPCFPSDMMSLMIVLATQVKGSMLFFEKMYPGRMFFADFLNGMGANIIIADPHRVVVNGPTVLRGAHLYAPDLRAGMAFVAAGLVAKGATVVEAVEHIDRGYPSIEKTLSALGASIKRVQ